MKKKKNKKKTFARLKDNKIKKNTNKLSAIISGSGLTPFYKENPQNYTTLKAQTFDTIAP